MGAMFELGPDGVRIRVDPDDNAANHPSPHHESGLVSVFEIANVGDEEGEARVSHEIDDTFVSDWTETIPAGGGVNAVHQLGRQPAGDHTFLIYVNPGSGDRSKDHAENTITVD